MYKAGCGCFCKFILFMYNIFLHTINIRFFPIKYYNRYCTLYISYVSVYYVYFMHLGIFPTNAEKSAIYI